MDASVLFPTFNGETTIRYTLESMVEMDTQGIDWELLICNNNSTDRTLEIINEFSEKLPLKVFEEKAQGMSPSLNCLLVHAKGQLVVMTNDDVIVDNNWLKSFLMIASEKINYDIFGGKISPYYMMDTPFWFDAFKYKHVAFALTPDSSKNQQVGPGSIFGPCMAIRRKALDTGVRFDVKIGPNGGEYVMGCETDFLTRLASNNMKCWFSDRVELKHMIRPFQFELSWIQKRARRYGLSMYQKEKNNNFSDTYTLINVPVWRVRLFLESLVKIIFGKKNDSNRANDVWEVGFFKGFLKKRITG